MVIAHSKRRPSDFRATGSFEEQPSHEADKHTEAGARGRGTRRRRRLSSMNSMDRRQDGLTTPNVGPKLTTIVQTIQQQDGQTTVRTVISVDRSTVTAVATGLGPLLTDPNPTSIPALLPNGSNNAQPTSTAHVNSPAAPASGSTDVLKIPQIVIIAVVILLVPLIASLATWFWCSRRRRKQNRQMQQQKKGARTKPSRSSRSNRSAAKRPNRQPPTRAISPPNAPPTNIGIAITSQDRKVSTTRGHQKTIKAALPELPPPSPVSPAQAYGVGNHNIGLAVPMKTLQRNPSASSSVYSRAPNSPEGAEYVDIERVGSVSSASVPALFTNIKQKVRTKASGSGSITSPTSVPAPLSVKTGRGIFKKTRTASSDAERSRSSSSSSSSGSRSGSKQFSSRKSSGVDSAVDPDLNMELGTWKSIRSLDTSSPVVRDISPQRPYHDPYSAVEANILEHYSFGFPAHPPLERKGSHGTLDAVLEEMWDEGSFGSPTSLRQGPYGNERFGKRP